MNVKKIILTIILILLNSLSFSQDYWESIYNSEEPIYNIAINSYNDLFVAESNGLFKSLDFGNSWELILDVVGYIKIDINNNLYCSPPPMFFSSNNGDDWEALNYPGLGITHIFKDSQNNIFVGFWGGIYKSSDNGVTWDLVLSFSNCEVTNAIAENSEGLLFAGTMTFITVSCGVYQSIDQGENWEYIGLEYEYISSLAINSNDEIFAGSRGHHLLGGGGIFRSSDNGETWIELRDDVLVTSVAIDSEDRIFIGCSDLDGALGSVYFSEDNGESWQMIESEVITPDIGIEFLTISDDDYLYAISYETVNHVYRSVQSTTTSANNFLIPNIPDITLCNYPNPFNPETTISYNLPANIENPVIEIFNIKGEKVRQYSISNFHSSFVWDGTDSYQNQISSGVYLYRLKSDNGVLISNKMLLLK